MFQWLGQNWQGVIVAILAIDAALYRLFPTFALFKTIQDDLSPLAPKQ